MPAGLDRDRPFRDRHDAVKRLRDHKLGDAGWPDGLDFEIAAAQAVGAQNGKQRVIAGVLIADDAELLAAQIGYGFNVAFLARDQFEQRVRTKLSDCAHWQAVGAYNHRSFAESAAEIGVAGTDLLGDIGAAVAGLKRDVDIVRSVVAALAGNMEWHESRQERRRGKQIRHLFGCSKTWTDCRAHHQSRKGGTPCDLHGGGVAPHHRFR